jgi:hypothetical protein
VKPLPVTKAHRIAEQDAEHRWLIESLWGRQAVGIIGGQPKCCKSFLALDMAVAVASGAPCLRRFAVRQSGRVLLYPAEDQLSDVRRRLEGICATAHQQLEQLQIDVITAERLWLDHEVDRRRLTLTVETHKPVLLILDPFIRLHRIDENAANEVAPLLTFLRQLQRRCQVAVALVHHAKKGAGAQRPGQALRGSSELHGWGDSNLYLARNKDRLSLAVEHRAAPSLTDIPLELTERGQALALSVAEQHQAPLAERSQRPSCAQRIETALKQQPQPMSTAQLRQACRMRAETVCRTLGEMADKGVVEKSKQGYRWNHQPPVSHSRRP